MIDKSIVKWWGWGDPEQSFDLESRPQFDRYLRNHFQLEKSPTLPVPAPEDFEMPACRLNEELRQLEKITGKDFCHTSRIERLQHSVGKSYRDLIRLRYRSGLSFPDAVVYPQTETQIEAVLAWARENRVALIPFGGGSSVVGGVEAKATSHRAVVTLDLRRLDKIVDLDSQSLIVEAEAGIRGPVLENYLGARGFTLGHSPESFEYSSLGGWIAARSSGQFSTRYGNIEDLLESVRMITFRGAVETLRVPSSATGPDLKQMILGSEGALGVITRARMRISPLPKHSYYRAYLLPDFRQGMAMAREIVTTGGHPALLRLSDGIETDWVMALAKFPRGKGVATLISLAQKWMEKRGFFPKQRSLMLVGLEGSAGEVSAERKCLRRAVAKFKTFSLGKLPLLLWYKNRYHNPYLRDELLGYRLLIDTLETAGEWQQINSIYQTVIYAVKGTLTRLGIPGVVGGHLSHMYPQGSSLYFIIIAQPVPGKELEQWHEIKIAASDAIIDSGGTISHHHGVGIDHKMWYARQIGPTFSGLVQSCKSYLDPDDILNPGKLFPGDESGV